MIIFLHGPDDWRREEKRRSITQEFLKKNPASGFKSFDMSSSEDAEVLDFLSQSSLFGGKKLAHLYNLDLDENKKFLKSLSALNSAVLLTHPKLATKPYAFLSEEPNKGETFEFLEGVKWVNFINKEASKMGLEFEPDAIRLFAQVYEKDTWGALTDLSKLSLLKNKKITVAQLRSMNVEMDPDFFQMVMRLGRGGLRDRLHSLQALKAKSDPAKIFNVVSAIVSEKAPQLSSYDAFIKSGRLEYDEAVLDLVLS